MKNWIIIIFVLFFLGIGAGTWIYIFVYNKPHPDISKEKPVYTLKASELFMDYKNHKVEAGKKYNGQVLQIKGKINKIEKNDTLLVAIFVFTKDEFGDAGIRCTMLPAFKNIADQVKDSEEVNIKGLCNGYNDTDVILEKCLLIKKATN